MTTDILALGEAAHPEVRRALMGAAVLVMLAAACDSSRSTDGVAPATTATETVEMTTTRPGSLDVYETIDAETDCVALQETFDRAAGNHDRADSQSEREYTLGYMEAADSRMQEVGCY